MANTMISLHASVVVGNGHGWVGVSVCVRELDDDDDDDAITPSFLHLLYIYTYTHIVCACLARIHTQTHSYITLCAYIAWMRSSRKRRQRRHQRERKKNTKNKNVIPTGWKRCLVIWRCWYTPIAHNAHKIVCVAPGAIMFPRGGWHILIYMFVYVRIYLFLCMPYTPSHRRILGGPLRNGFFISYSNASASIYHAHKNTLSQGDSHNSNINRYRRAELPAHWKYCARKNLI